MPSTGPEKKPRNNWPADKSWVCLSEMRAERKHTGVVLLPSREVEVCKGGDLGRNGPPGAAEIECASAENHLELQTGVGDVARKRRKEECRTVVFSASHPWSNISPSGPAIPVRRACLPSIASRLWYKNRPAAHLPSASSDIKLIREENTDAREVYPMRGPLCALLLAQELGVVVHQRREVDKN